MQKLLTFHNPFVHTEKSVVRVETGNFNLSRNGIKGGKTNMHSTEMTELKQKK